MDHRLLDILVCPICKGLLEYHKSAQELVWKADALAYPIRDGIPVMLNRTRAKSSRSSWAADLPLNSVEFLVIVPARLASTRLPKKPLADIGGVPMVVRVARNAADSGAARVVVAADDEAIIAACRAHGVDSILTSKEHQSGTDRLAEAARLLALDPRTIVVNVQGDEPLLPPAVMHEVATLLHTRTIAKSRPQRIDCDATDFLA